MHARVMKNGKLNLATLSKPSDKRKSNRSSRRAATRFGSARCGRSWRRATIAGHRRRAGGDGARDRAARGAREHRQRQGRRGARQARVNTLAPLRAKLEGKGGATFDNGAVAARDVDITVDTEGRELRKLAPDVALRGRWRVEVKANGPADKLALSVVATPPAGKLRVDAQLATNQKVDRLVGHGERARDRSGGGGRGRAARRRACRCQRARQRAERDDRSQGPGRVGGGHQASTRTARSTPRAMRASWPT